MTDNPLKELKHKLILLRSMSFDLPHVAAGGPIGLFHRTFTQADVTFHLHSHTTAQITWLNEALLPEIKPSRTTSTEHNQHPQGLDSKESVTLSAKFYYHDRRRNNTSLL